MAISENTRGILLTALLTSIIPTGTLVYRLGSDAQDQQQIKESVDDIKSEVTILKNNVNIMSQTLNGNISEVSERVARVEEATKFLSQRGFPLAYQSPVNAAGERFQVSFEGASFEPSTVR
jgi:chromosome condensin MukBEF ATPase and DNA-binding subunit MukB